MTVDVEFFRKAVTDEVATRVAIESRAGFPQGLTNKRFEDITAELIMADWTALAKLPFKQVVDRICGLEK